MGRSGRWRKRFAVLEYQTEEQDWNFLLGETTTTHVRLQRAVDAGDGGDRYPPLPFTIKSQVARDGEDAGTDAVTVLPQSSLFCRSPLDLKRWTQHIESVNKGLGEYLRVTPGTQVLVGHPAAFGFCVHPLLCGGRCTISSRSRCLQRINRHLSL